MNAVGHHLFVSPDSSSDPLPTTAGLWVFYQASLDAPHPLVRGLLVPPLPPLHSSQLANVWEWSLESKQGLLRTQGTTVLGKRDMAWGGGGIGILINGALDRKTHWAGFELLILKHTWLVEALYILPPAGRKSGQVNKTIPIIDDSGFCKH